MTMLDERLRRVGEELDRAAVAFAARSTERTYVTTAPARPRRHLMIVAVAAALALCVGAALTIRASVHDDDRSVADSPDGLAIARNLGDMWLWPNEGSDAPAGTPEEVAREFATRVLGLSEFTVVHEAPDPMGIRIETPTMTLSLFTSRVPGPPERWVVYELKSTELSLNGNALAVTRPPGTSSIDLFVRDASGAHAGRLDNLPASDGAIVFPLGGAMVSALAVFRDNVGRVIDAASLDAETITAETLIACTFELNGERSTASLHAGLGDTASANVGVYAGHVDVVEGRNVRARGPALRVTMSGTPALSYEAEGELSRTKSPSGDSGLLSGSATVEGGLLAFTCVAENPGSR
jgi:hypothetical protein